MIRKVNKIVLIFVVILFLIPSMTGGIGLAKQENSMTDEVRIAIDKVTNEVNKVTLSIGEKPNTGYSIRIVSIDFIDNIATISYQITTPLEEKTYGDAITEPKAVTFLASGYKPVLQKAGSIMPNLLGNVVKDQSTDQADIRGTIKEIVEGHDMINSNSKQQNANSTVSSNDSVKTVPNGKIDRIYVEAKADSGYAFDKAYIRIQSSTKIYKQEGDQFVNASKEDLKKGLVVDVTFDGEIALSYPVQTIAKKIIILESK